jgi:hypothetical protein
MVANQLNWAPTATNMLFSPNGSPRKMGAGQPTSSGCRCTVGCLQFSERKVVTTKSGRSPRASTCTRRSARAASRGVERLGTDRAPARLITCWSAADSAARLLIAARSAAKVLAFAVTSATFFGRSSATSALETAAASSKLPFVADPSGRSLLHDPNPHP